MEALYLAKNPENPVQLPQTDCVVIVGSNGAGKTRLGCWIDIESPQAERVHRISAQRDLDFPQDVFIVDPETAQKELLLGSQKPKKKKLSDAKSKHRWGNNPATSTLYDFYEVMTFLLSDHARISANYLRDSKSKKRKVAPPTSKLETLLEIWEAVLPGKELLLENLNIKSCRNKASKVEYDSSQMSDGERVIFYFIAQCLAAPQNGIIVLDEPETHIHKSLQINLWRKLREVRSDCLFVFLTHDIEFAAAQTSAIKIWLKAFNGTDWEWELIPPDQEVPEELLLKIMGAKKPILFVEGTEDSLDTGLYRLFYSDKLVIPVGGCQKVIEYTKAVRANSFSHRFDAVGIIDRDRRTTAEIEALAGHQIFVLPVAEVENLYCTPELICLMAQKLSLPEKSTLHKVSQELLQSFASELDVQLALRIHKEIKFVVTGQKETVASSNDIILGYQQAVGNGDVLLLAKDLQSIFGKITADSDYASLLKYYNRKKLLDLAGKHFGLMKGEYAKSVLRFYREDEQRFSNALAGYLPCLEE